MEKQLNRYFAGLVGFGFVACWAAAGALTAILAVATCLAIVAAPQVVQRQSAPRRRREARPRPAVRVRPLYDEAGSLPLVPDEPSLIVELG